MNFRDKLLLQIIPISIIVIALLTFFLYRTSAESLSQQQEALLQQVVSKTWMNSSCG